MQFFLLTYLQLPKFRQFQFIYSSELNFKADFFYSNWVTTWFSWIEQNVGEKFQLQFLPSFLFDLIVFFLVFSWVIQQPCFHDVKCCLLDARGASFLTSRNENYLASVALKFLLDFRALLFLIWCTERVNQRRSFLEHFREVSRAVNLVT